MCMCVCVCVSVCVSVSVCVVPAQAILAQGSCECKLLVIAPFASACKMGNKAKAAADVLMFEEQLAAILDKPIFDSIRAELTKRLEKARKLSIDKRTDAGKLADMETWAARETNRIEADTSRTNEMVKWIAQRQTALDAENESSQSFAPPSAQMLTLGGKRYQMKAPSTMNAHGPRPPLNSKP